MTHLVASILLFGQTFHVRRTPSLSSNSWMYVDAMAPALQQRPALPPVSAHPVPYFGYSSVWAPVRLTAIWPFLNAANDAEGLHATCVDSDLFKCQSRVTMSWQYMQRFLAWQDALEGEGPHGRFSKDVPRPGWHSSLKRSCSCRALKRKIT